jgi:nucleotide-binding universal stress UspA family protein
LVGPAEEIVGNYIERHAFDLLVLGAFKDRGAGSTADIGATAHHLLHYAPTSVLVVKRPSLHKLLACTAGNDVRTVDLAMKWAQALGAELQLLHVLPPEKDPPLEWSVTNDMPLNEILARGIYLQEHKTSESEAVVLDDLLQQSTPEARFLRETIDKLEAAGLSRTALNVQSGKLAKILFTVAKKEAADLIIIGRHSDPGHFLSSTANYVASYAPHSVLVVGT